MDLRTYKQVFYTCSGPKRPFAKQYFDKPVEVILQGMEGATPANGGLFHTIHYINDELMGLAPSCPEPPGLTFSGDGRFCVARRRYVPEGNVRYRYELEVLERCSEEELSPKEEAYFEKLKEFRTRGCETRLCISNADVEAVWILSCVQSDPDYLLYPAMTVDPESWELDFGPLKDFMYLKVVEYTPTTPNSHNLPSLFQRAVRAALYLSDTVDEAVVLANEVLGDCGCGRRLTDDELLSFGVDLNWYHRVWPRAYMGERNGYYFIKHDSSEFTAGMTNDPKAFPQLVDQVEERAYGLAMFSGGGYYRCGGRPV
jgi:hypothetical protein